MSATTTATPLNPGAVAAPAPEGQPQQPQPAPAPVPPVQQAPVQPVLNPNDFPSQSGPAPVPPVAPVPPAPQAPQAPQQQPPAQQPPAAELTLTEKPLYKHEPTGNVAYDMAMSTFAAAGFSPDHPAFLPASKGDFTALEQFVKEKGIDPQYLALARQAHQQITEHHQQVHGQTIKETLELVGGQERWAKVQEWVQATADPEEITHWKKQLEAGGVATKAAAKYLSDLYAQHGENAVGTQPASPFNTNTSPNVATNGAPLSPQEFRAELGKLVEKIGYSALESSAEYKTLQQRRLAWRG